jgi:hypothetical protein
MVTSSETNQPKRAVLNVTGVLYDEVVIFLENLDTLEPGQNYINYLPIFLECLGVTDVNTLLLALQLMRSDESGSHQFLRS